MADTVINSQPPRPTAHTAHVPRPTAHVPSHREPITSDTAELLTPTSPLIAGINPAPAPGKMEIRAVPDRRANIIEMAH